MQPKYLSQLSLTRNLFLAIELVLLVFAAFLVTIYCLYADIPYFVQLLPYAAWVLVFSFFCDALSHVYFKHMIPYGETVVHDFILYAGILPLWASCLLGIVFGKIMLPVSIMIFVLLTGYVAYDEFGYHWKRAFYPEQIVHYFVILSAGVISIILFWWAYL